MLLFRDNLPHKGHFPEELYKKTPYTLTYNTQTYIFNFLF